MGAIGTDRVARLISLWVLDAQVGIVIKKSTYLNNIQLVFFCLFTAK